MSLTQENSVSAYAPYGLSIHKSQPTQNQSSSIQPSQTPHTNKTIATESTPYTYQENDTGYIAMDLGNLFDPRASQTSEDEEYQSQPLQEHVSPREPETSSSQPRLEPQTPAAPVNPFANRGSVMKGIEMFGATQPSSIGRRLPSPTSSRPSPNNFNEFETPAICRTASSPLVDRDGTPVQLLPDLPSSSPLKGAHSFDTSTTKRLKTMHDPRRYNSMKESQEKLSKICQEEQED